MNIPRTKDGKYELLFPGRAGSNHLYHLRSAVEGRLMWEALARLSSDKSLVEKLDAIYRGAEGVYDRFFGHYDPYKDSEGIFTGVSLPLIARIKPDKSQFVKGTKRLIVTEEAAKRMAVMSNRKAVMGDSFQKPYERILTFDGIWNPDSYNVNSFITDEEFSRNVKGRFESNETRYAHELPDRICIRDVLADNKLVESLKQLSMFYVFNALDEAELPARLEQDPPWMCEENYRFFRASDAKDAPSTCACASLKLRKQVTEAAVALCNEYLAEMK